VPWAARIESALTRRWWRERPDLLDLLCLRPLAALHGAVLALRRWAYAIGWRRIDTAPVPVIVVGNLVAGGAGKTPTVIALVDALRRAGWTPGVISRGHGRQGHAAAAVLLSSAAREVGDEPLLIHRRTAAPVWVARRRIEAARGLCAAHPQVDVLVADDGLQHLALARALQVIVFDERGVGNGRLLPAGPLRQPIPRHVPVNSHVLYNAAQPSTRWPGALAQRQLAGAVALQDWWQGQPPDPGALQVLRQRPLLAVAGMAAPQRFFDMLRAAGLQIDTLALPDHHPFDTLPWPAGTPDVVVTEKDAVKLPPERAGATRVWVVALDFQLPQDFCDDVLDNLRQVNRP
jgi:tetraacyldisaccharide 4'-kinase